MFASKDAVDAQALTVSDTVGEIRHGVDTLVACRCLRPHLPVAILCTTASVKRKAEIARATISLIHRQKQCACSCPSRDKVEGLTQVAGIALSER
jgi:hypothetical protein